MQRKQIINFIKYIVIFLSIAAAYFTDFGASGGPKFSDLKYDRSGAHPLEIMILLIPSIVTYLISFALINHLEKKPESTASIILQLTVIPALIYASVIMLLFCTQTQFSASLVTFLMVSFAIFLRLFFGAKIESTSSIIDSIFLSTHALIVIFLGVFILHFIYLFIFGILLFLLFFATHILFPLYLIISIAHIYISSKEGIFGFLTRIAFLSISIAAFLHRSLILENLNFLITKTADAYIQFATYVMGSKFEYVDATFYVIKHSFLLSVPPTFCLIFMFLIHPLRRKHIKIKNV